MRKKISILALSLSLSTVSLVAQDEIIYGGASNCTGGDGYGTFRMTNLNDSGPGSLRAAIDAAEAAPGGTIVIDVSGTVDLSTDIFMEGDNITIAGETAPAGGITITGAQLWINASTNIDISFVRFRPDYVSGDGNDALTITSSSNIAVRNCSLNGAGDETVDLNFNTDYVTVYKCLMGEGNTGTIFGNSDTANCENNSIIACGFVNISHRLPGNLNSGGRIDALNNVIHHPTQRLNTPTHNGLINDMNNYIIPCGSMAGKRNEIVQDGRLPQIHSSGNIIEGVFTDPLADNWPQLYEQFNNGVILDPTNYRVDTAYEFILTDYPIESAVEAKATVIADSGANRTLNLDGTVNTFRDGPDTAYVDLIQNSTCSSFPDDNYTTSPIYIAFQSTISSTPINTFSGHDTDNDGIFDAYEMAEFGNLTTVSNTSDQDSNGVNDFRDFRNLVFGASSGGNGGGETVTPAPDTGKLLSARRRKF